MTARSADDTQPTNTTPPSSRGLSATPLRGMRLFAARLIWLTLALAIVGIFAVSVPTELALLPQVCSSGATSCLPTQLTPSGLLSLHALDITPAEYATVLVALDIFAVCCWCLVALALFLRRSSDRMALFSALTLVTFGAGRFALAPSALAIAHPQWTLVIDGARFLGSAYLSVFVYVFPSGHFAPRWMRWIALAWIAPQLGQFFLPGTALDLTRTPPLLQFAGFLAFVLSAIFAQVYRYQRVSTPLQQRQTRWVVFGVAISLAGYLALAFLLPLLAPSVTQPGTAANLATDIATTLVVLLIPLSIGIAILRAQLFDIDTLINRTLVYGTLTAILAALYTGSVVGLQAALDSFIPGSQVAIVASTLGAIALFQPLRLRIQHAIDRGFYRRKYDAAKTLVAFSATLRNELDLDDLRMHLLKAVRDTMHPAYASLWLLEAQSQTDHSHGGDRIVRQDNGTGDERRT
ncbi:MAG TPA: hypothetical protein VF510_06295 [Ktedonobacterales bacterium]